MKHTFILNLTLLGFILFLFSCSRTINGIQFVREKKNKAELYSHDFEKPKSEIISSLIKADFPNVKNDIISIEDEKKGLGLKNIIQKARNNKFQNFIEPSIGTSNTILVVNATQKNNFNILTNKNVKSDDPPIHWAAVLSFIFGTISIICIALYFFGPISIFVLPLQLISIALAITFGLIAKSAIKKNPDKYSGYKLARDGLKFGIAMLYLLLAVLLFGILFFIYIMS